LASVAEALLNRLPEKLRVVFVLFELEEMHGDEIAAFLNIPVGTARSRLRLARKTFRREAARLERSGKKVR
jgi:RNA polymerase sigma-70 factor (ECF subfamily)